MHLSLTDLCILGLFLSSVSAVPTTRNNDKKNRATTYSECQKLKPQGEQLNGCPEGTLYVSQTDPQANYGSIQKAIMSLPNDNSAHHILIGQGNYHEVLNISRPGPLALLGMTEWPDKWEKNQVYVWNSSFINQSTQATTGLHNSDAAVLTVAPINGGFGNTDFKAYNIDFANRATVNGVEIKNQTGPSAAVFTTASNTSFYGCSFKSYQDTVYVGRNSSAFFFGGAVYGYTDYLYGYGTAWFEGATMGNRGCGGGIIAWKGGETAAARQGTHFGVYQANGKVVRADDAIEDLTKRCPLGRPWNNASVSIYKNTYMSEIVLPQGFVAWSDKEPRVVPGLTVFGEYGSYGPGWVPEARNTSVQAVFTEQQAQEYTVEKMFGGMPAWIDLGTATIGN
ncbi:hypothetical protein QFC20_000016 [Naganishia adeliensis]|uniref:Uncharacterized protein n=1 Tax=Naganishia adeliensis TaxID=92952 RepID=A0ACC2X206_9TREE|nr:hypothetical protein QFC20_000016 [Naganishia adeliensis]